LNTYPLTLAAALAAFPVLGWAGRDIERADDAWNGRPYMGASWGTSRWDFGFQPGLSTHPDTQAQRLWLGYDARLVAVEIGWVRLGQVLQVAGDGRQGELLARALSADFIFKLPLGPVEPFVKVGPTWSRTDVRGALFDSRIEEYSLREAKVGVGLNLKLGSHAMLRAEYERYTMGEQLGLGAVNVYTVGAAFRF